MSVSVTHFMLYNVRQQANYVPTSASMPNLIQGMPERLHATLSQQCGQIWDIDPDQVPA